MARLYADENFPYAVVVQLRLRGHDVLTVQEAGRQGSSDAAVLAYAAAAGRAVLTLNRSDFIRLHAQTASHRGIVVCTDDAPLALASRIDQALLACPALDNQLLRINRPP
jgi:predicted nuclease of predicted toxin-antitoxin system